MKNMIKKIFLLTLLLTALYSCKEEDGTIPEGQGEVSVKLTDAPFPFEFVSDANFGVAKVELKKADGEYIVVFEASASGDATYNLLDYTNGATVTVETNTIDVGTYTQARITYDSVSIQMNGSIDNTNEDTVFEFGNDSSGSVEVSIDPALEIEEGEHSDVLFDIDVNQSFQFSASGGGILGGWFDLITDITGCSFNPAIRVCDLDRTGEITGHITVEGNNVENVHVSVNVGGHEIASHTKADGTYTFIGIEGGNYNVSVDVEGHDGSYVQSVTISGTETGVCNFTIE